MAASLQPVNGLIKPFATAVPAYSSFGMSLWLSLAATVGDLLCSVVLQAHRKAFAAIVLGSSVHYTCIEVQSLQRLPDRRLQHDLSLREQIVEFAKNPFGRGRG